MLEAGRGLAPHQAACPLPPTAAPLASGRCRGPREYSLRASDLRKKIQKVFAISRQAFRDHVISSASSPDLELLAVSQAY